jgi:heme/copper-type cytochrome/quinol oxidase subunit 4
MDEPVTRENYKTRKEYKWAKKNADREHARATAYWRYPSVAVFVLMLVLTHVGFLVALLMGVTTAVVCVGIKRGNFGYKKK